MPPRAATLPLLIVQGDWAEAWELAQITRAEGSPLERQMAVMILGNLAHWTGNTTLAWQMVRELVPRGPDSEPEDGLFPYASETLRLAARLALDEGNQVAIEEWLTAHDRWLQWSGAVRGRAESAVLHARFHHLQGDLESARDRANEALQLANNPRQPLTLFECYVTLGRIALDSGDTKEAEGHFNKALSIADACAAPYQRCRVLIHLADIERARQQEARVSELLEDARAIAQALGAGPLLDAIERQAVSPTTPKNGLSDLTARELDVLRLVTQGMTDAEVAARLFISPRTVGQHLRSIYNKLGVSSRAAATRIAIEDHLI